MAKIRWQDHVWNTDVSSLTGLGLVLDPIIHRRSSCPPSLAVPHRFLTRSPSRPELEVMVRPPSEQMAWPTEQGQQYTSCWPLEMSHQAWTLGGDATVLNDSMRTTNISVSVSSPIQNVSSRSQTYASWVSSRSQPERSLAHPWSGVQSPTICSYTDTA